MQNTPRRSGGCRTLGCAATLILGLVLLGGMAVAGWFYGDQLLALARQWWNGQPPAPAAASIQLSSQQGGEINSPSGAQLTIPSGAVPLASDGSAGTMVFSIEEDPTQGFVSGGAYSNVAAQVGPVYQMGPDGFTFNLPLELALPIPAGLDPQAVFGLVTLDPATQSWNLVPSFVDPAARTISTNTTHLSSWGIVGGSIFGSSIGGSIAPGYGTPMPDIGGSFIPGEGTRMPDIGGSFIPGEGTRMPDIGGSIIPGAGTPMPDIGGSIIPGAGTPMPIFGGSIALDPQRLQAWQTWQRQNGGWIEVRNAHQEKQPYSNLTFEIPGYDGKNLPVTVFYGVCIETFSPDNPAAVSGWAAPNSWMIAARGQVNRRAWLPSGSYTLSEFYVFSETDNTDFDYLPRQWAVSRLLPAQLLRPGETLTFDRPAGNFQVDGFVPGRPNCFGTATASPGTGDVQITLTWHAEVDLDLIVEDPNGEVIMYLTPRSSSGGELDRDNKCGEFLMGHPENIYWPSGNAPSGVYKVRVNYFGVCAGEVRPITWNIRTIVMGVPTNYSGVINAIGETQNVTDFRVP